MSDLEHSRKSKNRKETAEQKLYKQELKKLKSLKGQI